jgi:hypothetical protein
MSRIHSGNGVPDDCVAAALVRGVPEEENDEEDEENEEKQGEDEGEEDEGEGYSE